MGKMKEEFMRLQETPIMDPCSECQGAGTVEVEVAMPHNAGRDVGELYCELETCDACGGGGEVGGIGHWRQFVTEIGPGDDRPGGDGGRQLEAAGDAHQADAEGSCNGPGTANTQGDDGADRGAGEQGQISFHQ